MNLRWTIVGLILLTLLGLVAVVSITLQSNLGPLFYDQERQLATATMGRIQEALDERYRLLETMAINLTRDDATYAALGDGLGELDLSAFTPQRFTDLDIHLMALIS